MIQSSPFDIHHFAMVVHSPESSLKPVVGEALHRCAWGGHTPYKCQVPSPSGKIRVDHTKQRIQRLTSDDVERSMTTGCVDLDSVAIIVGLLIWAFPLSLVAVEGVGPWFCKALDKTRNSARSNCLAGTPGFGADTDAGAELREVLLVGRC